MKTEKKFNWYALHIDKPIQDVEMPEESKIIYVKPPLSSKESTIYMLAIVDLDQKSVMRRFAVVNMKSPLPDANNIEDKHLATIPISLSEVIAIFDMGQQPWGEERGGEESIFDRLSEDHSNPTVGFLHSHPGIEEFLGVPEDHVIVNREDWEKARYMAKEPTIKYPDKPIDKVTIDLLDVTLRLMGVQLNREILDKVIDAVELIEDRGDSLTLRDITKNRFI